MSLTDLNIRIATNGRQCNYWHMAAITLLFWDHLLSLEIEIKYLWKKPLNSSGYLFIIQRYFNPIAIIFTFVTLFDDLPVSCKTLSNIRQGILIIAQLVVTLIMTLRIHALYGCKKRLLYFLLSVIASLLSIVLIVTYTIHLDPPQESSISGGCSTQLDSHDASRAAVAWLMIFIYDVLLFGLMVHNAFKTRKELHMIHRLKFRASLRVILLRDGAMYFGVMTLVNLANILTYYFSEDCMRGGLAPFTSSLSVTLVSRLMLNLHQVKSSGIYLSGSQMVTESDKTVSHMVFREPGDSTP
ncbi:uncharacterized protein C8R40DRAFT_1113798 [Lentinula edodes]|uniref:uncharacterized protein n=1 Tax=Lentinula edodes TaxID=5353 RepID=UPI001E8E1865|nr:uncharacterized protein C8R40DRAFT_1113798 [Lentinula edodes]KAH7873471.1 hypothetical protein C8R40DRAFT_1113798 [Lentinula edodes]